jgi:hypothetical protein
VGAAGAQANDHTRRALTGLIDWRLQMLMILIIILIVLALGGGGYGFRSGWYGGSRGTGFNGLGLLPILLIIVVLILLFRGGIGGP